MEMLGVAGVLLGIVTLIILAVKGFDTVFCSLAAAIVVIVFNAQSFWGTINGSFATSMKDFVGNYLLLFVLGSIYGAIMAQSGAAKMVAYWMMKKFGKKYSMLALILATSLLNFGGVSVFVIMFAIYPIAVYIFRSTDTSRRFLPAVVFFAAGTYTMTALPGNSQIMNLIPIPYLGTDIFAAPIMGIIVSLFMFGVGYAYLMWAMKKDRLAGVHFEPKPGEVIEDVEGMDVSELPSFTTSVIPIIMVVVIVAVLQNYFSANDARNMGMTAAIIFLLAVNWKRLGKGKGAIQVLNEGISSSMVPIMATAAVVGFGGVVSATPAFGFFVDLAKRISEMGNPYVSGALSVNILAGICGSSLGGTQIFYNTMIDTFLEMNINPAAFHRIIDIASSGLDSLPHCGTIITMMTIVGVKHKEAYMPIFVTSVAVTILATILAILLAMVGIV